MFIKIWGCRGSVPFFSRDKIAFGCNTTCVQIVTDEGQSLIFDGGTGIIDLGARLGPTDADGQDIHIFFTHFHWDHIQGVPFFQPAYNPRCHINLYGQEPITKAFSHQMTNPYFPYPFDRLPAELEMKVLPEIVELKDAKITHFAVNHPQGCVGYVVEMGGKKIVFCTDSEADGDIFDKYLMDAAEGADYLILDAQFTEEEFEKRRGWGHSSWNEAIRKAERCGVKHLVLFHHDPFHNDEMLYQIEADAQGLFRNVVAAREHLVIEVT